MLLKQCLDLQFDKMKLLLTSSGLTNDSIAEALFGLVGKEPGETSLTFIPTASNVEIGDKDWFITDLVNLQKRNFNSINITDISAVERNIWLPQLESVDVLFFEGGNTYHLMRCLNKSGLKDILPDLLKEKVYVGVSAGSMVACPDLLLSTSQAVYGEDLNETQEMPALNYVDFYFLPHLNSKWFPDVNKENIAEKAKDISRTIYALDDHSAIKIVDGKMEVVSEGDWAVFNKK